MAFLIHQYLDSATHDPNIRQHIIAIHDDLHAAYKIVQSVTSDIGADVGQSEKIVLSVFHEIRKKGNL